MVVEKEALQAYRRRWQAVAELEAAEQRAASLAERWQQMNALLRMALALELPLPGHDQEADEGHQRWNRLRALYPGKLEPRIPNAVEFARQSRVVLLRHEASGINVDIAAHPDLDTKRITDWVQQFADVLEMPELWADVEKLLRKSSA